jgi:hypothetical protein
MPIDSCVDKINLCVVLSWRQEWHAKCLEDILYIVRVGSNVYAVIAYQDYLTRIATIGGYCWTEDETLGIFLEIRL